MIRPIALTCLLATALHGIAGADAPPKPAVATPAPTAAAAVPAEAAPAATATDVRRYTVLMAGNAAGTMVSETLADGRRHVTFEFHDRGRGPQLTETLALGADGVPTAAEIGGQDYLKNKVEETFRVEGGNARWQSAAEKGERTSGTGAYYWPFNATPEDSGLLAAALLRRQDKRLPLLPDGEANVQWEGGRSVEGTDTMVQVAQYTVSGLDFVPTAVWLDSDRRLFALVSDWLSVVREGFAETVPELLAAQEKVAGERWRQIAAAAHRRPHGGVLAITGARLFDPATLKATPGTTVVITDDRITAVGPDGEVAIPAGADRLAAAGQTLMPGLWDMHTHLSDVDGPLQLAAGVTTVRDLANDIDKLTALKSGWDSDLTAGPRVLRGGFLDGPGPYAGPSKVLVATEAEARTWVDRYRALGYDQIKIYSSLDPKLVPAVIDQAHRDGLRVSGHIPAFMTAAQAVELGLDEIQHVNFLFLNFFFDQVQDTRTPARFTALAEHAADLDLGSDKVRRFLTLLADRHVVVDPTVTVFEQMLADRTGEMSAEYAAVADRLPAQVRRGFLAGGLPVPAGKDVLYRRSAAQLLKMVKALYDRGITIVAGTDGLAGFTLQRELENYATAGIPAPQVLALATLGAARVMKRDGDLGTVAPGKLADLILIDGQPDQRIADIRNVRQVMKGGVLYDPAALYRALGVKP